MKAWQIKDQFGLEHLTLSDMPTPKLNSGEILLKMEAASLNYRDMVTVAGGYGKSVKTPLIPCSDGVGVVAECGPDTNLFQVGDRICPSFFPKWKDGPARPGRLPDALGGAYSGTLCEYMAVSETACVKAPDHLSPVEAASLPCAALTAWSALFELSSLTSSDCLVIQGTGGVALFALQLAKAAGAQVLITSSSDNKLEKAKALGADYCVNYLDTPEWDREVKKIWAHGADHIIELGGAQTLEQSIRATRIGGHISLIGVLSGANTKEIPLPMILMRNICIQGVTVGSRSGFERMNSFISKHQITPVIDRTFDFDDAVDAFRYLEQGQHFGKVCVAF
ncbi:NAD(P)-dependent alcohol dehydrogenase [Terasakiella sp. A23]|uniref:zinc-dependent alcohol dehydrogenase family protein n=1 Tax=Terasakiella sp. FCG-A23 TaxID=3080561 RepID=UPI002954E167|nr:NAD(P)-dependent alcohol dehydrogenase [Terasakiella sp. A23]MDV7341641.1 NAD(P)-dependent alcohol dehydrogenase [Terasakiella sp. A23]